MNENNESNRSLISEDLTVDGNVETSGAVEISGNVNGHVSAASLKLDVNGKIKGNVKVDKANLLGHHNGKVVARQLTVHSGAVLKGSVNCEDLIVESGASISGKFRVKPKK